MPTCIKLPNIFKQAFTSFASMAAALNRLWPKNEYLHAIRIAYDLDMYYLANPKIFNADASSYSKEIFLGVIIWYIHVCIHTIGQVHHETEHFQWLAALRIFVKAITWKLHRHNISNTINIGKWYKNFLEPSFAKPEVMFSSFGTQSWKIMFYLLIFSITVSIKEKQLPETKILNNMLIFEKPTMHWLVKFMILTRSFQKNSKHPEFPSLPTFV